jgi:uncharacterized protein YodC (DUF2158 family)
MNEREPPLQIGNLVRLNSGGPILLVVDVSNQITVAWRDQSGCAHESTLPEKCLHRPYLSSI